MTLDPQLFRQALSQFVTGVTVITTLDPEGKPLGFTANSFNSVSLEPPLVLWSLARSASTYKTFASASHYAVNVLSADQVNLSMRFASPVDNRFQGLNFQQGVGGVPLIENCAARFQCERTFQYEGGDHLIFVARVLNFDLNPERDPLIYHRGDYASLT